MSLHDALARRDRALDAAVQDLVRQAAARVPAFARRCHEAGVVPDQATGVADLDALPVLDKDAMVAAQRADPPFAGLLAPDADVERVFQSPGPLYEPQLRGGDWRWGQVLADMGVGRGDVVLNCFGYHLSPAGEMMEQGALAAGASVLPGGIGNQDLQAAAIAELGVTAYTGLPSYLKALLERFDAAGFDPGRWRLGKAMVTAEPLPPSLREVLTARINDVRMAYGTAETGLLAYETADGAGMRIADGVLVQVCDLDSGTPVTDETEGQVVITLLRTDYPLVRFGTGDLSGWMLGADGQPRLRGVLGRVGQAVKVRGMFLHPRQVEHVMTGITDLAGYRFVITREDNLDALRCEVVAGHGADGDALAAEVRERVREGLRFRVDVTPVVALAEGDGPLVDTRDWS
ncbi:MAG: AMP-binding protein [Tetrasphaera sp.]